MDTTKKKKNVKKDAARADLTRLYSAVCGNVTSQLGLLILALPVHPYATSFLSL